MKRRSDATLDDRLEQAWTRPAGLTAALLTARVSYHRIHFGRGQKPEIVRATHTLAQLGLVLELLAVVGAIYLVLAVVTGSRRSALGGSAFALIYVFLWTSCR
jgi:hypothetical protein